MPGIWFRSGAGAGAGTTAGVSEFGAGSDVAGFAVPCEFIPSVSVEAVPFLIRQYFGFIIFCATRGGEKVVERRTRTCATRLPHRLGNSFQKIHLL